MKYRNLIVGLVCALSFASCQKDDNGIPDNPTENDVNKWIEGTMRDNYLWYQDMPEQGSLDFNANPEKFFAGLLSDKDGKDLSGSHHYFSYLEKAAVTKAISNDNDSYGFDFATSNLKNGSNTYKTAVVIYVLKNSPAEEAGLKRGDWILGVNGQEGTITNYNQLRNGGSVTFQLARQDGQTDMLIPTHKATIAASRSVQDNPFIKDSIYTYGSKRIGYLMYNHFVSGPDGFKDTAYDEYMRQLFARFKSQGVNEFVLDLRYNGGGQTTCAQLLASLLAPQSILGKTFCQYTYNDKNEKNNSSSPFLNTQQVLAGNLDLKRLFVLTGQTTASASELVINSLIPYPEVNTRLIGQQTLGKTVGMNVYDESDTYGWILSPVSFRIYNANHEANYANGFAPNVAINEFAQPLLDLGEVNEPLLSEAIAEITGQRSSLRSTATPSPFEITYTPRPSFKNNLLSVQGD